MGVETVTCPSCGAQVDFGVPRGGSVVSVTAEAPEDEHGTFEEAGGFPSESNGRSKAARAGTTKHRAVECPAGHEFGVRFRLDVEKSH